MQVLYPVAGVSIFVGAWLARCELKNKHCKHIRCLKEIGLCLQILLTNEPTPHLRVDAIGIEDLSVQLRNYQQTCTFGYQNYSQGWSNSQSDVC